jgi:hypothetical protein
MSVSMQYEPGMRILHHVLTKTVTISFRNKITHLGPFNSRDEAIDAAEDFCRKRGWGESSCPSARTA